MSGPDLPVVVVGASLGGLAAAVRLAKLGHQVTLVDGAADPTPSIPDLIELPAAWRDLFRKSGRILDAALAEEHLDLVPAPPRVLADGVRLPTDRGEQFAALTAAYGTSVAESWRDLLDEADDAWQVVRRAGLETHDLTDPAVARLLARHTTVADLAERIAPPALRHVVEHVAQDRHVDPAHAPAWWVTELCVRRTFSTWQLVDAAGTPQPGSRLANLLLARADRRGVERRTGIVTAIQLLGHQSVAVRLSDGSTEPAAAVVSGVDLWQHRRLTGQPAPALSRRLGPVPLPSRPLTATDTQTPTWEEPDTWRALEPVAGPVPRVAYAGSGTVAGDLPWARLLVGALATYEVHEWLTGEDVRPANKSGHRSRAARVAGSA